MDTNRERPAEHTFAVKDGPVSETVLRAVDSVHDGDVAELRPIYEVIDLDALDALFRGPNPGTVAFEYASFTVTVRAGAEVVVRP